MQAIEFQTTIKEIRSSLPKEKWSELSAYGDDEAVRVIVLAQPRPHPSEQKDLLRDAKEKGYEDFLDYLIDHPLPVTDPARFSRDELHER
jgi:hypothetical protein